MVAHAADADRVGVTTSDITRRNKVLHFGLAASGTGIWTAFTIESSTDPQ